jgi:hypothetical protein
MDNNRMLKKPVSKARGSEAARSVLQYVSTRLNDRERR